MSDFEEAEGMSPEIIRVIGDIRNTLPDYRGFAHLEDRRSSDDLMRAHVVRLLGDFQMHLLSLMIHLAARNLNTLKSQAGRIEQRVEMLSDKVQSAPYAFSPFFTADKVPEEIQEKMIQDDQAILAAVSEIERTLEPTLDNGTDVEALLDKASDITDALDNQVEARLNDIMMFR